MHECLTCGNAVPKYRKLLGRSTCGEACHNELMKECMNWDVNEPDKNNNNSPIDVTGNEDYID